VVSGLDERTKIFKVAEEVEAAQNAAAETVKGAKAAGETLLADVGSSKVKLESDVKGLQSGLAAADTQLKARQADIERLTKDVRGPRWTIVLLIQIVFSSVFLRASALSFVCLQIS